MILVTGGTGFLGSELLRQLLDEGREVRAIKRPSSTIPADLHVHPHLQWVEADMNNYFELEDAFEGIQEVYHCAAMISFEPADKKKMIEVNRQGTAHIVNLSMQFNTRLLHVSSVAAIGDPRPGQQQADEQDIWEFDGTQHGYAISKYESEMEVWRGMNEGLNAVILNPSLIIGHQAGHQGTGAIFKLLKDGLRYYTAGSVGLIDVEDAAKAAILLMKHREISSERFIVSNANLSYRELFHTCSQFMGREAPRAEANATLLGIAWRGAKVLSWFTGKKPGLTHDTAQASLKKQAYSNRKLTEKLSFSFKPIEQTLQEICEKI